MSVEANGGGRGCRRAWWLVLALLAAGLAWLFWGRKAESPARTPAAAPDRPPIEKTASELTVIRDSEFDRDYSRKGGNPADDLRMLGELLFQARTLVKNHASLPLGDNADFTRFLQGANPHRAAWIRPGHPAVSASGEILDRWGTPVFFHAESSSRTTLRSAGPDRKMWTDDDVIWLDSDG